MRRAVPLRFFAERTAAKRSLDLSALPTEISQSPTNRQQPDVRSDARSVGLAVRSGGGLCRSQIDHAGERSVSEAIVEPRCCDSRQSSPFRVTHSVAPLRPAPVLPRPTHTPLPLPPACAATTPSNLLPVPPSPMPRRPEQEGTGSSW